MSNLHHIANRTKKLPPLRVGILGLSHDHVWGNVAALAAAPHGRLVAASDADPRLRSLLEQREESGRPLGQRRRVG